MGKIKKSAEVVFILALLFSASYGISTIFVHRREASQTQTSGPDQSAEVVTPEALLAAINAERAKVNVAPLRLDSRLNDSAQRKVDEIESEGRQPNPHLNKSGIHGFTYAKEAMPECRRVAENIVWGFQNEKDKIADGVNLWLGSAPHRAAILNPVFTVTGFGIGQNDFAEHFCQL